MPSESPQGASAASQKVGSAAPASPGRTDQGDAARTEPSAASQPANAKRSAQDAGSGMCQKSDGAAYWPVRKVVVREANGSCTVKA